MSGSNWRPSKGQYGIFGRASGSQARFEKRGKTEDKEASSVKDSANQALQILKRQYDRAAGISTEDDGESFYQEQLGFAEREKEVAEESFIEEADRKASALRQQTTGEMRKVEQQTAQSGFAGSGTSGRAREDLARSIQEQGANVYEDLTRARVAKDIEMDKTLSSMEQEQLGELDRIEMEASGIISQTEQALSSMERKALESAYKFKPTPGLDYFAEANRPEEGLVGG